MVTDILDCATRSHSSPIVSKDLLLIGLDHLGAPRRLLLGGCRRAYSTQGSTLALRWVAGGGFAGCARLKIRTCLKKERYSLPGDDSFLAGECKF
ncbi:MULTISPECIES: hypothetical protein [unclassified Bradyrhizobium]|uniref:hypothetical protein n=1 Tax=unclassified Bradyrhizobium TaxID=2631580 RepID=UPI00247A7642|nr:MULTISPECIES: hypothetical protein [unclassified Bradyrhizobium]WGR70953.1 hypothetical protein MTX24_37560 [Bradyrhizobium sp. ISRA426]WGR75791.1 hypothetical protein MTX21_22665 [Bradyrhizobium sp. ISRA430]WGR86194.1 hypothetical protein MTX25_37250 [Bradyrhizobium sp. ISRA432]